jgi:predicted ATPase/transcriptional regulator with XRE-family HTH domain
MAKRAPSAFGALLRSYREAALQSQEELAERSGLSVRAISDLERGVSMSPRLETVRMLGNGLSLGPEGLAALTTAARPSTQTFAPPALEVSQPASLPRPLTALVGRKHAVTVLTEWLSLSDVRLLTLTGPGGVGKTRVALAVAAMLGAHFPDGVYYVELASISDPTLVPSAVAQQLGVREIPGKTLSDQIVSRLQSKNALVILDNFEHVLPAGTFVADVLTACPQVTILATSRAPLRVRGEREWPLAPLELPDEAETQTSTDAAETDAVQLFVQRAREVRPEFALTDANAAAVVGICHRVDGLPLALELAAARLKVLTPEALLLRLEEHRLPLLIDGAQDLPARQQTMRETVAWSYDLLNAPEQALFRRLAAFAGGWTVEAAEAVAMGHGKVGVLDGLTALMNGSLVRHRQGTTTEPRFEMLETVREYGLEQVVAHGEGAATREAHDAWLLDVVRQAGPGLLVEDHAAWLARLDDELANMRAGLAHAIDRGSVDTALEIAAVPWLYWFESGRTNEGRSWLDRALVNADAASLPVRAMGRFAAASLAATQGDYGPANVFFEASLADWTKLGDKQGVARTRHGMATAALELNDDKRAARLLDQVLPEYGTPRTSADAAWVALAVTHRACAYSGLGEHDRAIALGEQAVAMQREAGSQIGAALGVTFLADFALERGDYPKAHAKYLEGLSMMWDLSDRWHLLYALTGYAIVMTRLGPPKRAARLLAAQSAVRNAYGNRISPRRQVAYDVALAEVRASLGERAFSEAWAAGASLGLDEVVAEIMEP